MNFKTNSSKNDYYLHGMYYIQFLVEDYRVDRW